MPYRSKLSRGKKHNYAKVYKNAGGNTYRQRFEKQRYGGGFSKVSSMNFMPHTPLLPLKRFGKLPYNDAGLALAAGAGVSNSYVFTANGLFDPNITGAGHQPMGFDQLMLFYEHYTVTKCKLTVNFINTSAADVACVGILIAPDTTIVTDVAQLNENGLLAKKYLNFKGVDGSIGSVSVSADISKINGKKDVKSEDDFRGDVANNPVEQTYFHIFAYNPTVPGGTSAVSFDVVLEYEAIFTEPRKMIKS